VTTEPSPLDVAHEWARQTLGHDQATDIPSMLREIASSNYLLPGDQIDAAQIAFGSGRRAQRADMICRATHAMRRQRLIAEIAQFQQQFFELSCDERDITWQALSAEATEDPDLMVRLAHLQSGLDVECPPEPDDANQQRLWKACGEIFLASPPVAAALKAAMIAEWRSDPATWDGVARAMMRGHRRYFQAIAPWIKRIQRETRAEISEARRLRFVKSGKLYVLYGFLPIIIAICGILSVVSPIPILVVPGLLAGLIAWAKGYRPRYWLLSLPQGLFIMLCFPDCSRSPPEQRLRQRAGANVFGMFVSGMNLFFGTLILISLHEDQVRRSGAISPPYQSQQHASPVTTPSQDSDVTQRNAAFEATRILMGIPDDPTPEQKAIIEQGITIPMQDLTRPPQSLKTF